jgi:hypothetical protein
MPSTSALITTIKTDFAPDWSRARILALLNQAYSDLVLNDTFNMVWQNTADPVFPFPILSTTAGTLLYTLSASNLVNSSGTAITLTVGGYAVTIRKIVRVFVIETVGQTGNYTSRFSGEVFRGYGNGGKSDIYSTNFREVPGTWIPAYNDMFGAKFQFAEDPGTYSDRYYVEFYYAPPQLTSESIPMVIDTNKWTAALIDGTVGQIEDRQNGDSKRLDKFRKYWIPQYLNESNDRMTQRRALKIPNRPCG